MTFEDLQNIFQTPTLIPWEHDYYVSSFEADITQQEFLDYAYTNIDNLDGIWYEVNGLTAYFVVKKGTVIPNDFANSVELVTEVPEQPTEGTE